VFYMRQTGTQSGNLILEPCVLFGNSVLVLFDSGQPILLFLMCAWGDCNW